MKVEDVMTPDVVTVEANEPLKDAGRFLSEHGVSGAPVIDPGGSVVGVISEADIVSQIEASARKRGFLRRLVSRDSPRARTAAAAMSSPPVTVSPGDSVASAAALMLERGVKRLPVLEGERLVGIVTRADLVRSFLRSDEAIAEEIAELQGRFWLEPGAVTASVLNGVVTLDGEVDSKENAEVLEWAVGEIPGVVALKSWLTWRTRNREFRM